MPDQLEQYLQRRVAELNHRSDQVPRTISVPTTSSSDNRANNRSVMNRQLTRQQFLKWTVPAGVGVLGVTIAGQLVRNSSRQPLPLESPEATPEPGVSAANSSSSLVSADYSKLEEFLKAGQWKEADQETARLMLKAVNQQDGYLEGDTIKDFPCDVLNTIDRLWVDNSQEKYGFSVQKKIYIEECRGKPDGQYYEAVWQCFGNAVGWRINGQWISYEKVTFDTSAKKGHLPWGVWGNVFHEAGRKGNGWLRSSFFVQKLVGCSVQ